MSAADEPVIGSVVTYHGSLTDHWGPGYLLLPDLAHEGRYVLADPGTGRELAAVRPGSFTASAERWWPADAVLFNVAGYWYPASHSEPGGSDRARIVRYFTQPGAMGGVWCSFPEKTPEIRALDARRLP
ncbi:hypothetical protein [Streptomyces xinghaiensis]|uniref:hypothetical protein n=1 Tax=Streptomyces xinghaiensis TaxID=1038928 RepID=UPI0002E89B04|nr:hypothetical protein [Streptomyces xinghaiensis]MZE80924.1 hypothetical protein [Streptomyces sp. SID5475]